MICNKCADEGHYWFAEDDQEIAPELERKIGIYADCDMRQVFSTLVGCECGCHKEDLLKEAPKLKEINTALYEALKEADEAICDLCIRLNPQHGPTVGYEGCNWCQDREARLKALALVGEG